MLPPSRSSPRSSVRLFTALLLLKAASALLPACNIYTIKIWTRGLDLTPRSRHHGQIDRDKWAKWIGKYTAPPTRLLA